MWIRFILATSKDQLLWAHWTQQDTQVSNLKSTNKPLLWVRVSADVPCYCERCFIMLLHCPQSKNREPKYSNMSSISGSSQRSLHWRTYSMLLILFPVWKCLTWRKSSSTCGTSSFWQMISCPKENQRHYNIFQVINYTTYYTLTHCDVLSTNCNMTKI